MKSITFKTITISLLPALLLLVIFEIFFNLKKTEQEATNQRDAVAFGSELIANTNKELNTLIYLMNGMEAYIKVNHNVDSAELNSILTEIHKSSTLIRNFGIAEGYILKHIVPLKTNEAALGIDYRQQPEQWPNVLYTIQSAKGTLSGPVALIQGGEAIIYRKPIFINNQYWGMLSTVIDLNLLFENTMNAMSNRDYWCAVKHYNHNGASGLLYGDSTLFNKSGVTIMESPVPNGYWKFAVLSMDSHHQKGFLKPFFWLGRIFAILVFISILFILQWRKKRLDSEVKYKILANNVLDVIWVYNINKNSFSYISPSVFHLRGYTAEEVMHETLEESITPEFLNIINQDLPKAIEEYKKNGESQLSVTEIQQPCKDGSVIWVEISTRFNFNKKGEIEIFGVSRNIDKRKKFEFLIQKSEDRLKAIINTTMSGIAILDAEGNTLFTNKAAFDIHGYSEQEIIGKNINNIIHADEIPCLQAIIWELLTDKREYFNTELRFIHKETNEVIWTQLMAKKYPKLAINEKESVLLIFQNTTKLRERAIELKALNATKDRLFSIIAHDLRSPLGNIQSILNYIDEFVITGDTDKVKKLLAMAQNASKNSLDLLQNLLDWARTQLNSIKASPEIININAIISESINVYAPQYVNKKVDLVFQPSDALFVHTDVEMIKAVLRNLLSNALKFTPASKRVSITTLELEQTALIAVTDQGVGMDSSTIDKLFDFSQNKSTYGTDGEKGTGLGLVLSNEFLIKNKSKLMVESQLGMGSTFSFKLPKA